MYLQLILPLLIYVCFITCCFCITPPNPPSSSSKKVRKRRSSRSSKNDDILSDDVDFYEELKSELDQMDPLHFDGEPGGIVGGAAGAGLLGGISSADGNGVDASDCSYLDLDRDSLLLNGDHHHHGTTSANSKEEMYAAYNELHNLAQSYSKGFDAPAVVVVGHQSSGKSALMEALMGFQFNQVGGGTKTRRPIALRMQFHPECEEPRCYLTKDDGEDADVEQHMSLQEIQAYIEDENRRLERDPLRSFDPREIRIRVEYKHCPNMILIDTPGLIASGQQHQRSNSNAATRALQQSAQEAERLVVDKIRCRDYFILCVEDTVDWKHGPTRCVVQKADPDLRRTVIVNTKLDTKLPQLGTSDDVSEFLRAPLLDQLCPTRMGGAYFTSVPSGRVGRKKQHLAGSKQKDDYNTFLNDSDFVRACQDAETADRATVYQRFFRSSQHEYSQLQKRVGLTPLRDFLEKKVDDTYKQNVARIIPLLQNDYLSTEKKLSQCDAELASLSLERLKAGADAFCDDFCVALRKAIQGSVTAPASLFGETLSQEIIAAGSFSHITGSPMSVSDRTWDRLVVTDVGHSQHRLYGGAQYHRTLREFNLATRCLRLPSISEDEIANAAGMGTTHDGMNFLHAACVIALEKARRSLEPMLESLQNRVVHVFERLCPVTEYMLLHQLQGMSPSSSMSYSNNNRDSNNNNNDSSSSSSDQQEKSSVMDISQNAQFRRLVREIFDSFVRDCSETAMVKCRDDLAAITRYVTWNLQDSPGGSSASALQRALPDQTDLVAIYQVAVQAGNKADGKNAGDVEEIVMEDANHHNNNNKENNHNNRRRRRRNNNNNNNYHHHNNNSGLRPPQPQTQQVLSTQTQAGGGGGGRPSTMDLRPMEDETRDYYNLLQVMEEAVSSRNTNRTNMVIGSLVQHIVAQWRASFGKQVTTKFNCYFMLPFVDDFHKYMRQSLAEALNGDSSSGGVFDLQDARRALQQRRKELSRDIDANQKLQDTFRSLERMMRKDTTSGSTGAADVSLDL